MGGQSEDPTVVRSIAVHAEDLVAALEASRRSGRETVLRVTPPYSGRMRARIHEAGGSHAETGESTTQTGGTAPDEGAAIDDSVGIHVDPAALVADSTPAYPSPADTGDAIRADPDVTYSRELHRERHAAAVADWRAAVPEHVVDTVTVETAAGPHEIAVQLLGTV